MLNLIEDLKKDHILFFDKLNKVKELGILSSEGRNELLSVKAGLLAHLKKEDVHLYPSLKKAAENDKSLKQTLDIFAKDMDTISKEAIKFFSKYSKGESGTDFSMDFAKDFGKIFATLKTRIQKEETILYREYERLKL